MNKAFRDIGSVFWEACKETPRGMYAPFKAFIKTAVHNPVLEHRRVKIKLHPAKRQKRGDKLADHCSN